MTKEQQIIDELKVLLKSIPQLAGVWHQRTFPTRQVYPSAVLFFENETNEAQGIDWHDHQRTASLVVALFAQGTQDAEKVEASLLDLKEAVVRKLTKLADPLTYIVYGGTTFGVEELDPELPDTQQLTHRAELRFKVEYCYNFKEYL